METTTKQLFHYNNEALLRMARIFLTKYGYTFNQFLLRWDKFREYFVTRVY
jgi:hypothetical protein